MSKKRDLLVEFKIALIVKQITEASEAPNYCIAMFLVYKH